MSHVSCFSASRTFATTLSFILDKQSRWWLAKAFNLVLQTGSSPLCALIETQRIWVMLAVQYREKLFFSPQDRAAKKFSALDRKRRSSTSSESLILFLDEHHVAEFPNCIIYDSIPLPLISPPPALLPSSIAFTVNKTWALCEKRISLEFHWGKRVGRKCVKRVAGKTLGPMHLSAICIQNYLWCSFDILMEIELHFWPPRDNFYFSLQFTAFCSFTSRISSTALV